MNKLEEIKKITDDYNFLDAKFEDDETILRELIDYSLRDIIDNLKELFRDIKRIKDIIDE